MAQLVPITVGVLRAATKWVSRRMEQCKKWPWPLNWLCNLVWVVVVFVTVPITIFVCGWRRGEPPTTASDERETDGVR